MPKWHLHEFYRGQCLSSPHTSYGGALRQFELKTWLRSRWWTFLKESYHHDWWTCFTHSPGNGTLKNHQYAHNSAWKKGSNSMYMYIWSLYMQCPKTCKGKFSILYTFLSPRLCCIPVKFYFKDKKILIL